MANEKLPAQLAGLLVPAHKRNNTDQIIAHLLCEDGSVTLTDEQKTLLERADYADRLMADDDRKRSQIPALIVKRFGGSESTGWRDMQRAGEIFGKSRRPNRDYLLLQHLDRIERAMQVHRTSAKATELAKLYEAYTRALEKLPSEEKARYRPAVLVFNFSSGNSEDLTKDSTVSAADAEATALRLLEEDGGFVDFEEINDDDDAPK